jgi:hypothetical protein
MRVMVIAEVAGQTEQGYDGMLSMLEPSMREAPGFVFHSAHPIDGGWRIIEVWESKAEANAFFARNVHPNLPPGISPRRSFQELHSFVEGT